MTLLTSSAFFVGRCQTGEAHPAYRAAAREPVLECPPGKAVTLSALQFAELRSDVLRALSRATPSGSITPQATSAAPAQAEPDESQRESASTVRAVVDTAVSRGEWSDRDKEAIRAPLQTLAAQDRAEIMDRFGRAINSGTMKVTTHGPPL